VTKVNGLHN